MNIYISNSYGLFYISCNGLVRVMGHKYPPLGRTHHHSPTCMQTWRRGGRGGGGDGNHHHHETNSIEAGGGELNIRERKKRFDIEGDRKERTCPRRGRGHFYDNIER